MYSHCSKRAARSYYISYSLSVRIRLYKSSGGVSRSLTPTHDDLDIESIGAIEATGKFAELEMTVRNLHFPVSTLLFASFVL